jgi:diguanylate cyclase (GGDEF)-like protein
MKEHNSTNKLNHLFNNVETPYIIFDCNYYIIDYNPSAKNIIPKDMLISTMVNQIYLPIIKNGVENKFPFIISEKRRLNKTVLYTSSSSYKLIVKPIEENLFLMECIEINAVKRSNTFLIKKINDFVMKSSILEKLIAIKSKNIDLKNVSAIEILELFEEQLNMQFELDDAISDIIVPIISKDASIYTVAYIVLSKLKQLTQCEAGLIISGEFTSKNFNIFNNFGLKNILPLLGNENKICNEFMKFDYSFFYNNYEDIAKNILTSFEYNCSYKMHIFNIMLLPINIENSRIGELVLFNSKSNFTNNHLEIAKRLVQLYSLVYERDRSLYNLEIQAYRDVLTNCLNRRAGLLMLENIYETSKRYSKIFSIVFIDINGLKLINDTLGHEYGDKLIKITAEIIDNLLRHSDIFIRFGGDEFLLVLPGTNLEQSFIVTERIQNELDNFNNSEKIPFEIGISKGNVVYDKDCKYTLNELIEKADSLMYIDKRNQKNSQ